MAETVQGDRRQARIAHQPREPLGDALRVEDLAVLAWVPNEYGGNEDLDAVRFLKDFNSVAYREHPGAMTVAEESTAWPSVSRDYRIGLPTVGRWVEILNTDHAAYGGSDVPDTGVEAEALGWAGQPASARVTMPPLATNWLTPS
jgi:1,4-alpha-glucan branching enzyme